LVPGLFEQLMFAAAQHHSGDGGISAIDLGVGIAAISALASAASARSSARGVALSHRPFVVGSEYREWTEILNDQGVGVVGVKLRNEGPGVALGVRFRARAWSHSEIDTSWSPEVGSIPPGGERLASIPFGLPPGMTEVELGKAERTGGDEPNYVLWYVETEFADITGLVWTARFRHAFAAAARPQRVRTHSIEFWRPPGADA
jgi:hypothetical protein